MSVATSSGSPGPQAPGSPREIPIPKIMSAKKCDTGTQTTSMATRQRRNRLPSSVVMEYRVSPETAAGTAMSTTGHRGNPLARGYSGVHR